MVTTLVLLLSLTGCQVYEFVFMPDDQRQGSWLHFTVETPSRADLLFVVDNSQSMADEQASLAASFSQMLEVLAPQDTSYRIGLVSTDAHGFQVDCCGERNPLVEVGTDHAVEGARGNCQSCVCNDGEDCFSCSTCVPDVAISRPHDGTKGRLLAAYDPEVYAPAAWAHLSSNLQDLLPAVFPLSSADALHVIDRELLTSQACGACGCPNCGEDNSCEPLFDNCIEDLTSVPVEAHFRSNLQGLGVDGFGWEEGIKSALLAVGLDPEESDTLQPGYNLVAPGAPNSLGMNEEAVSWVRDDAVLAIAFVTDEEDCSMPAHLMDLRHQYEVSGFPVGSICYQPEQQERFLDVRAMATQLLEKKDNAASRMTVSVIGGVAPEQGELGWSQASPTSCVADGNGQASSSCHCFAGASAEDFSDWCQFTSGSQDSPACDALPASRYLQFANVFDRRSFESICKSETNGFGDALKRFALLATEACFGLEGIAPYESDASNIRVHRRPREQVVSVEMEELAYIGESGDRGWYYNARENKICLSQIDRRIRDRYSIFVVHTHAVDYTR